MGDAGNWSGILYGDAFERWLAPNDTDTYQGDASDWYAGGEEVRTTADPDERPIFVYFAAQDPHGPLMAQEKYYTTGICGGMVRALP